MKLAGNEVPIVWNGRRARAFVPMPLAARDLELGAKAIAVAARAGADVVHAAEGLRADYEPLARLLLRAEGVASSYIEGVWAPVADVVVAEQLAVATNPAAAWVAANLAALADAVDSAQDRDVALEDLCRWHRVLMTGSPLPERYVGVVRSEQGWIGGADPTSAALVTPPPEALGELLEDLVTYLGRTDVDPVAQAAIAHAQFEIIHPFADGNGRVGRVLVASVLARRLSLVVPPPVSVAMAADTGGYFSGLTLFRLGDHNAWVRWMSQAVSRGGRAQQDLIAEVATIESGWRDQLSGRVRRDAVPWQVLGLLPGHLVLTTSLVEAELGVTNKAANAALGTLREAGILAVHGTLPRSTGRPARVYVCPELLALAGSSPLR